MKILATTRNYRSREFFTKHPIITPVAPLFTRHRPAQKIKPRATRFSKQSPQRGKITKFPTRTSKLDKMNTGPLPYILRESFPAFTYPWGKVGKLGKHMRQPPHT
ncbi:hypothetical protein CpsigB_06080 [Corynebacterium pseudotuberculosis]|uniref:Uncharacterized protein n=1 Tax=Corynebacterium pseudotuberculosis (strain C231) TaxID=681645 RepID=D9QBE5_CORP2|nr:hypothetical protein CPC231_07080 [Corynebacterium pseudotuberculosis C231]ADL21278.1 hypothetical protein CP1002_06070 [Corynebacterium pseudotuberculosis 1002]ADO26671.2 hypothetical protein CPI19_04440 [Corynebacterium pseudotuberculosis I19]AEK92732.1 Hypothetical protein CpPAT10_1400 [Corynebacterium pseudotuberculosis PAT10]AEP70640.1 Hypothetical protein Cp4202_1391 [Corynebacterium pseudotuberculosis 42/02-A]AFF22556.1 Hypothetical protein CpP54B96_1424 [Corynebacterium pseudotuberc